MGFGIPRGLPLISRFSLALEHLLARLALLRSREPSSSSPRMKPGPCAILPLSHSRVRHLLFLLGHHYTHLSADASTQKTRLAQAASGGCGKDLHVPAYGYAQDWPDDPLPIRFEPAPTALLEKFDRILGRVFEVAVNPAALRREHPCK